jgi:hypothetical protein
MHLDDIMKFLAFSSNNRGHSIQSVAMIKWVLKQTWNSTSIVCSPYCSQKIVTGDTERCIFTEEQVSLVKFSQVSADCSWLIDGADL